jgi:hypothetical protein
MRPYLVVQHDDGTPTGSRSTSFFIRGILGPDAWSIFMRWLRRLAERFTRLAFNSAWRWFFLIRPLHNALIEDLFDKVESQVAKVEHPQVWSSRV